MTLELVGSSSLQDFPKFLKTEGLEVVGLVAPDVPKQDERGNYYGPGLGMIPDPKGRKLGDGSPFYVYAVLVEKSQHSSEKIGA